MYRCWQSPVPDASTARPPRRCVSHPENVQHQFPSALAFCHSVDRFVHPATIRRLNPHVFTDNHRRLPPSVFTTIREVHGCAYRLRCCHPATKAPPTPLPPGLSGAPEPPVSSIQISDFHRIHTRECGGAIRPGESIAVPLSVEAWRKLLLHNPRVPSFSKLQMAGVQQVTVGKIPDVCPR